MPMKKYKSDQIVTVLQQIELEIANGKTTPQACRDAEITGQTYYRWRREFGGQKLDQAKRLKELERVDRVTCRLWHCHLFCHHFLRCFFCVRSSHIRASAEKRGTKPSAHSWTSRSRLCFELQSEKSVVGPNGPKSKTKLLWKWLQALDSRELNGAPGEIQTSDPLLS